jgi:hypothetical protein
MYYILIYFCKYGENMYYNNLYTYFFSVLLQSPNLLQTEQNKPLFKQNELISNNW